MSRSDDGQPPAGPLDGVRVIDLTSVLMGPLATRILGDLGADVVRVEMPGGDELRNFHPQRSPHMSWFTLNLQRNKRSVVVDLKTPEGRAAMHELLGSADVFVTNLREAALGRLGLSWDDVRGLNDRLIYCIANGFGSHGPYRDRTAYDDVVQAVSGIAAMPIWFDRDPEYVPTVLGDKITALHMVYAINASLFRRERVQLGERIEVPMAECVAALNLVEHLSGHTFDPPEGSFGYNRILARTRRPRRVADGWICFLPYTDRNWRDFFEIAASELVGDARFADRRARVENADALYEIVDRTLLTRTLAEWLTILEERSIPAAPIRPMEDLESDPHFAAVGLIRREEHPTEGAYRHVSDPVSFGRGTGGLRRHAPRLGEHTEEILGELRGPDQGRPPTA